MASSSASAPTREQQSGHDALRSAPVRRFRTRCFERTDRWFARSGRLIGALYQGFWLGCLSANDLNAVTAHHFNRSQFYASPQHNLSGLFPWEKSLFERYLSPGSRILVAAAGGGREVIALRKAGFDADGFECSQYLVDAARKILGQLGESNYIQYSPPDCVPSGSPVYSGLVVGWGAYTHIPTRTRRISFLRALRERALPHSAVLLSFFTRSSDSLDDTVVHRTARLCSFFARGRKDPVEIGDRISFARYVHAFTRKELEAELREGGFQVVDYLDAEDWGYAIGIAE